MKFVVSLLAATAFALTGLATISEESASAANWPTGCTYKQYKKMNNVGTRASCSSGGGYYRAVVVCRGHDGQTVTRENPNWVRPGTSSYVFCPSASYYQYSGINQKAG